MKIRSTLHAVALTAALAGTATTGCSTSVGDAEEADDGSARDEAEPSPETVLQAALADLELDDGQKAATSAVVAELATALAPVRLAKAELGREVAAGIRAGALDHAKVDPRIDAMQQALAGQQPALQALLDRLHDALEESQREDLVDALVDRMKERRRSPRDRMQAIADELALTEEQRDAIKDAVMDEVGDRRAAGRENFREMRERMKELADAFISDEFDAKALDVGTPMIEASGKAARFVISIVEVTLPHLDRDQRERLAGIIEKRTKG